MNWPMIITDYTTEELLTELKRRELAEYKTEVKARTDVTKFIRKNLSTFQQLAVLLNDDEFTIAIDNVNKYVFNCVDFDVTISDGKDFLRKYD